MSALNEVNSRPIQFPEYPQTNKTYLSFSHAHGYQVNYLGPDGKAWLWYPGNRHGVPELYRLATVAGTSSICWKHPSDTYNPVTKQSGRRYACEPLTTAQRTQVAVLDGDPFNLRSGGVPYRLDRCKAPDAFTFDSARYGC